VKGIDSAVTQVETKLKIVVYPFLMPCGGKAFLSPCAWSKNAGASGKRPNLQWKGNTMQNPYHNQAELETEKRRKRAAVLAGVTAAVAFAAVTLLLWKPLVTTFQQPEQFRTWVDAHHVWGRLVFVGIDMLQVVFAFLPGEPVELGAGYAFSTWEGTALCLIGDAMGTAIIFLLVKRFGIRWAETFVNREKLLSVPFLKDGKRLNLLAFILFLIPGTPKDLFTYVMGLTRMTLGRVVLLTSVARIPSVLTSTITGNALGVQDYRAAIWVYAVTGVVSIGGILVYRAVSRHQKEEALKTVNVQMQCVSNTYPKGIFKC